MKVSGLFLVFLVFLVLKLCGQIGWSWWWVSAPLWGPVVLFVVGVVLLRLVFVSLLK
jgi:hypothetical protein